jgi:hypothetical protein
MFRARIPRKVTDICRRFLRRQNSSEHGVERWLEYGGADGSGGQRFEKCSACCHECSLSVE